MVFQNLPIKRKVMAVIMLTSIAVLLLTAAAFMFYDLITFRQALIRNLETTASIIADESTAALAYGDEKTAREILAPLRADPQIVRAGLYDTRGNLFVRYPATEPVHLFPLSPGHPGYHFEKGSLVFFMPVAEGDKQYGTLYLKSDLRALYARLRLYAGIALLVLM